MTILKRCLTPSELEENFEERSADNVNSRAVKEQELRNYVAALGPFDEELHNYHHWGATTKEGLATLIVDNPLRGLDFYERYVTHVTPQH